MVCEEVVLVLVVVKTLGIGLTDAVVVNGLEVPGVMMSDVKGALNELVTLHISIAGWFRALLRPRFNSTSARSPSEEERPRGLLRLSDDGLDSFDLC
jgi:hypothetical protein